MDGISELAKLFKERENKLYLGPQIGIVISPLPDIQIAFGDKVILTKEHLIISENLVKKQGKFKLKGSSNIGSTTLMRTQPNSYEIVDIDIDQIDKTNIEIEYELKAGDKVILIPTANEQQYYVIDKVVSL